MHVAVPPACKIAKGKRTLRVQSRQGCRVVPVACTPLPHTHHLQTPEPPNLRSKTDATHVSVLHTLLRITGHFTATESTVFWGTRMHFSLNNTLLCVCVCVYVCVVCVCVWCVYVYVCVWCVCMCVCVWCVTLYI